MTNPCVIHLSVKCHKFKQLGWTSMSTRDDTEKETGSRLDWYSRRRPRFSHQLEADTRNWNAFEHKSAGGSDGTKRDVTSSVIVALPTRVAVSSYWSRKQAALWCRYEESSTEIKHERWLWTEHEGLQWKWSCSSLYSVWLPLSISYFIHLKCSRVCISLSDLHLLPPSLSLVISLLVSLLSVCLPSYLLTCFFLLHSHCVLPHFSFYLSNFLPFSIRVLSSTLN